MFSKKDKAKSAPPAQAPEARRGRGRPRGTTAQGAATRQQLYAAATRLIADKGYEATTLRDIAAAAEVSVGLLYRYFPSKEAIVLALYDELSAEYAERALAMPSGPWRVRFLFALRTSLKVLARQRSTLAALTGLLVADSTQGLFAPATAFSRQRVESVFRKAVTGASDAPAPDDAEALARVLYAAHLAIILWWLLDKSPRQRATKQLLALIERTLPMASIALTLAPARAAVRTLHALLQDGLELYDRDANR